MIKHIVMWQLKESADGQSKAFHAQKIKTELEALKEHIEQIVEIEVGIDVSGEAQAYDLVLYSTFESKEALDEYQNHPEHKRVGAYIASVRSSRVVVDYNV